MKASEIRTSLQQWLDGQLTVDSWVLDMPIHLGDTTATISPVLKFEVDDNNIASVRYELYYNIRLPNTSSNSLPIGLYEGVLSTITLKLNKRYQEIHPDVIDVSVNSREIGSSTPQPITVVEDNDGLGQWVLTIVWSINMTVRLDPEVVDPEAVITLVKAYIYSTALDDFTQNAIDAEMNIDIGEDL